VIPSARSEGGVRLYTEPLARLRVVKRMKPLGFTLDEMHELLQLLDALAEDTTPGEHRTHLLALFHAAADARVQAARAALHRGRLRPADV
jgi:MerR family copper efflux transcriptional regulator